MSHRASLVLRTPSPAVAQAVAGALSLEAREGPEGCRVEVRALDATLEVDVEADNLSDLRAALNSIVRLLDAAQRVASMDA